jgi:hypothetical protein
MNLNEIQERINRLLSFFMTEVKGATAMGRADINRVSEVVLVPLLSKVFGYPNLANLNQTERVSHPAIDLGDPVARVAFQVTSTSNSKKVKETLAKFVKHELYKQYDHLIIYNLAEKQGSYSGEGFGDIIQGKFKFDKDKDIIDYRDVLKVVSSFQIGDALEILHLLEANFGAGDLSLSPHTETPKSTANIKDINAALDKPLLGQNELITWCVEQILQDQFTTGDAAGAWSKRYPSYLNFIYGEDGIPSDVCVRDTISYSGWIASALKHYASTSLAREQAQAIDQRMRFLRDYLVRHYEKDVGGFGLTARPRSRKPTGVEVDLRHTCWAMLTLWELGSSDHYTDHMLRHSGSYVFSQLEALDPRKERAITYAVLHKLIATDNLSHVVMLGEKSRRTALRRIENILVEKLDNIAGNWDSEFDPLERAGIDNTLIVLYAVPAGSCIDPDCVQAVTLATTRLCESKLVMLPSGMLAAPFYEGGEPDIGASLLLLYILNRDQHALPDLNEHKSSLVHFVKSPESRERYVKFAYPWYLAASLYLC